MVSGIPQLVAIYAIYAISKLMEKIPKETSVPVGWVVYPMDKQHLLAFSASVVAAA